MVVRSTVSRAVRSSVRSTLGSGGGAGGGGGGAALTLDNVTSAVLAWSIARKLRTAHSGPLIRVRRSSDALEADIGVADNVLDESSLTTHTGAGSGFLTTYYDQSGDESAVDFVQSTTTIQPRIVNAGTIDKLGEVPVSKQNVNPAALSYCESNNWGTRPSSAVAFLVCDRGVANAFIATRSGGVFAFYPANNQASTSLSSSTGVSNSIDINGALLATNGIDSRDTLFDGLPSTGLFLATMRGLDLSNAALAYIRQARSFDVGGLGFNCVAEFIVLDNPTSDEINAVEADIAAFYGITLS